MQLRFFRMHLTTRSFNDFLSGFPADYVFALGHLAWSLTSHKAEISVLFLRIWEDLSGFTSVKQRRVCAIAVLCLTATPSKGLLQKGSKAQVWIREKRSGICSTGVFGWSWSPRIPPGPYLILDSVKPRRIVISTMMLCPHVPIPLPWHNS